MEHEVVSREEWLKQRVLLLKHEKALTKHRDLVSAERLRLPWVRVEKEYIFDAPDGKLSLSDLFQGRSQLYIKHFMMAPGARHQCVGCSLQVDHMTDLLPHLENHDITFAVVARAPIKKSKLFASEWDGNSCGSLRSTAISTMISTSRSDRRTSQRGARNTIFSKLQIGREISRTFRAEAFSTRMTLVTSSIHIQPMAGAVKKSWESMEFSTPCRRAATRPVPIIRC